MSLIMSLSNKNVIYIGGFGGIGFATCKELLQHGIGKLIICDVEEQPAKLKDLQSSNEQAEVSFLRLDLTKAATIEAVLEQAHKQLGNIDMLVNGSGIMNEQTIRATVDINLLGPIHSTFAAMQYMDKSKGGSGGTIVNISSLVGLDAYGAYAVYTATKYGLNGFARALADPFYYARTGISFITICPSTTETPMLEQLRQQPSTTFAEMPPLPDSLKNTQSATECAVHIIKAITIGTNGSFWMISGNRLKEYHYPTIVC